MTRILVEDGKLLQPAILLTRPSAIGDTVAGKIDLVDLRLVMIAFVVVIIVEGM